MTTDIPTSGMRWVTFDDVVVYARVDRVTLAGAVVDGALSVSVRDPWSSGGALLSRQVVDTWWRGRVLSR
jgi:hypothetical protein